ncbi:MAG: FAD-binding oxidoreductase [Negativicutes bacterium]|nr:FAD-binding oxidoreductase [Negativicutes bacterium]
MDGNCELSGRIVLPQDPDYDRARRDYNRRFSRFPRMIVYCREVQDVVNAIHWARRHDVPIRVRSGGHSYEAFSLVDDGVIIDVSGLDAMVIDSRRHLATVGTGWRLLQLYAALCREGLTIPGGDCPAVGIGGFTAGGGFGMLTRLLGMACDSLVALEMVNARGQIIRADEKINADLLWACRGGGGGNFGVLTSYMFKVYPLSEVAMFHLFWDWEAAGEVMSAWQNWAPFVDRRLTSTLRIYNRQDGRVFAEGQFAGPEKEMRRLMQPLLAAVQPVKSSVATVSMFQAALINAGYLTPDGQWQQRQEWHKFKNSGAYAYRLLPSKELQTVIDYLRDSLGRRNYLEFQALAGAVNDVRSEATAYFHRRALFNLQYSARWEDDSQAADSIRWVEDFRTAMLGSVTGNYVNFPDLSIRNWPKAYYGTNFARLQEIKAAFDPGDVFHFPQSIPLP